MLKRLFQQSGVYALANVATKASGFVLFALYQNPAYLSQAEFGYLGVLDAVKLVALLVAGAGLPIGLIRFASSGDLTERQRAAVPATSLALAAVAAGVVGLLGWVSAPALAAALFEGPPRVEPVRLLALYVAAKTIADVSYTELRRRERAGTYVLVGLAEMAVMVAAVAYFLAARGEGLTGVMKGYVVSAVAMACALTPVLLLHVERRVRTDLVRPMLAFGVPLIVSGLAGRFLNIGDRFLILDLLNAEAVAVYEWASRFGGIVNMFLVQSLQLAFAVLGLKALDETGSPDLHRRTFRHYVALAGLAVLGLGLFVTDVARLLPAVAAAVVEVLALFIDGVPRPEGGLDPAYVGVEGLVVLIGAGFGFYGLYVIAVNVLYAAGRSRTVAASVLGAALLNLVLNVLLIPILGLGGAAAATLVSYAALAVGTALAGERVMRAGYPWRVLVVVSAVVVVLWGAGQPVAGWPLWERLAVRAGLVGLGYPLALGLLGVYGRGDLQQARRLLERRREHAGSTPRQEV